MFNQSEQATLLVHHTCSLGTIQNTSDTIIGALIIQ